MVDEVDGHQLPGEHLHLTAQELLSFEVPCSSDLILGDAVFIVRDFRVFLKTSVRHAVPDEGRPLEH